MLPRGMLAVAARTCRGWFACCPPHLRRRLSIRTICGRVELLQWACQNGYCLNEITCNVAAKLGKVDVLQWARAQGCPWSKHVYGFVAAGGNVEVLEYVWKEKGECWDELMLTLAIKHGCVAALKWLQDKSLHQSITTATASAEDQVSRARPLFHKFKKYYGSPWHLTMCYMAAEAGQLEVLKWAREQGCPWDAITCNKAAEGGHLEVLKWAREQGCPWNASTCTAAAEEGHLEVLKWAREQGCPWDTLTFSSATLCGNLGIVQWLWANGCPWDKNAIYAARNHPKVLNWLQEHGCS
ncbi:Ankyrin repeat domain containing protein [Balamuthia mandrillaris]